MPPCVRNRLVQWPAYPQSSPANFGGGTLVARTAVRGRPATVIFAPLRARAAMPHGGAPRRGGDATPRARASRAHSIEPVWACGAADSIDTFARGAACAPVAAASPPATTAASNTPRHLRSVFRASLRPTSRAVPRPAAAPIAVRATLRGDATPSAGDASPRALASPAPSTARSGSGRHGRSPAGSTTGAAFAAPAAMPPRMAMESRILRIVEGPPFRPCLIKCTEPAGSGRLCGGTVAGEYSREHVIDCRRCRSDRIASSSASGETRPATSGSAAEMVAEAACAGLAERRARSPSRCAARSGTRPRARCRPGSAPAAPRRCARRRRGSRGWPPSARDRR